MSYQRCHPWAKMKQYQTLEKRLASFMTYKGVVPPETIASAGFFYTCVGDKMKCPFCLGSIYDLKADDDPLALHSEYYPNCRFVKFTLLKA